jgi:putative ABC transport system permease protein
MTARACEYSAPPAPWRLILWLAVRSLLGHARRSLLTAAAIGAGLAALVFLWAFNDGLHRNMLDNFQNTLVGSLQIHQQGFFDNPELGRHIRDPQAAIQALRQAGAAAWTRRLETFALVASSSATEGSFLIGIDPPSEARVTRMHQKVTRGRFISPDDEYTAVIGSTAARNLGVAPGDELVIVAYDSYGVMTAESFRLAGIIESGEMGIDKGLVLVPLSSLQEMLEMQGRITDIPVRTEPEKLDRLQQQLRQALSGQDLEILRWHDMFPVMQEWVTLHNGFLTLFLAIVLLIVMGGVLNTMLLSMLERTRELGIFMALGERHRDLALLLMLETLLIGLTGVALGLLLGLLSIAVTRQTGIDLSVIVGDTGRFYVDPVIVPSLNGQHLAATVAAVLAITLLAGLYPAWRAGRLSPAEALRSV